MKRLQVNLSLCVSKLASITSVKATMWNLIVMLTRNVCTFLRKVIKHWPPGWLIEVLVTVFYIAKRKIELNRQLR